MRLSAEPCDSSEDLSIEKGPGGPSTIYTLGNGAKSEPLRTTIRELRSLVQALAGSGITALEGMVLSELLCLSVTNSIARRCHRQSQGFKEWALKRSTEPSAGQGLSY